MNEKYLKAAAVVALLFALSPFFFVYFSLLKPIFLFLAVWLGVWTWFIYSKSDATTRGLVFLTLSIFIATLSKVYLRGKEDVDVLEMAYQLLLYIGGGVGANAMAHGLFTQKKR